jgi:hypothetical protein
MRAPPLFIRYTLAGKYHYKDEDMKVLHREDGPAIEFNDGGREWMIDGKLHRTNGPAVIWVVKGEPDYLEYWINGEMLTKEEFDDRVLCDS